MWLRVFYKGGRISLVNLDNISDIVFHSNQDGSYRFDCYTASQHVCRCSSYEVSRIQLIYGGDELPLVILLQDTFNALGFPVDVGFSPMDEIPLEGVAHEDSGRSSRLG